MPPAVPPARSSKTIIIALIVVLVAFVSGAAAGILADHLLMMHRGPRGPHAAPHRMLRILDRRLDLTPDQHQKVREIIERHHARIWALSEGIRPQIHREIEAANAEIEAVLTPAQREKFER